MSANLPKTLDYVIFIDDLLAAYQMLVKICVIYYQYGIQCLQQDYVWNLWAVT